jgi:hypothetical protein
MSDITRPERLRQTLLSKASDCPHSAYLYFKQVELGEWPNNDMARGTIWHEVAARAISTLAANGELQMDAEEVKAILYEVLTERTDVPCTAGDVDMLRVMCQHFGDLYALPAPDPRVELAASVDIGGWPVTGTIDLLWVDGDTLHIRDWKAGRGLYRNEDVSGSSPDGRRVGSRSAQLNIYTVLAIDGLGYRPEWIDAAFVFPYFLEEGPDGVRIAQRGLRMHISEVIEHRLWLETLVNRVSRGFRDGKWPAVSGRHCTMCPNRPACPRPRELRSSDTNPYERDPSEIAEEAMFLREDAKMRIAELKPFAERYGPIPVGKDKELSFKRPDVGTPRFDFRKLGDGY